MSEDYANPDCPKCHGRGFIYGESMLEGGHFCECARNGMRLENMGRIWAPLPNSGEIPGLREKAPLRQLVTRDLWVTAKDFDFQAHLKAVAYHKPTMWDCRVFSDKDLLTAWLNTARAQGRKIHDAEIEGVRINAMDVDELVESPALVLLMLGVKQAPNKEAPSVLLEAIGVRRHLGKPTWIIDQPDRRVDDMRHLCYSETLEVKLFNWIHVELFGPKVEVVHNPGSSAKAKAPATRSAPYRTESEEAPAGAEAEAEGQIEEALEDLDEDKNDEGELQEEGEGGEEEQPAPSNKYMDGLLQNEAAQEEKARRKAWKTPTKRPRGGGRT